MSEARTSAREAILAAVRAARPPAVARPEPMWPAAPPAAGLSRRDAFVAAATAAGAEVVPCTRGDVERVVQGAVGSGASVRSHLAGVPSTPEPPDEPHALAALDVFVGESPLGVAENGAVWIATSDAMIRAALFLAARVVIVVDESQLVADLHEAYEHIDVRAHAFGAFVAGPSKTADIEQALVVGAHGPKALTLVLVRSDDPA